MDMQDKILIEFTQKQLRSVTFYYTAGVIATTYVAYKVTCWGMNQVITRFLEKKREKQTEKEEA